MRKLKLESLTVESFETVARAPHLRGTVEAHCDPQPTPPTTGLETYNVDACGDTRYFDCSLGCPSIAPCDDLPPYVWVDTNGPDCA